MLSLLLVLFPRTYPRLANVSLLKEGIDPPVQYLFLLPQVLQRNLPLLAWLLLLLLLDEGWRVPSWWLIWLLVPVGIPLRVVLVGVHRELVRQHMVGDLVRAQLHAAFLTGDARTTLRLVVDAGGLVVALPRLPIRLLLYLVAAPFTPGPGSRFSLPLALKLVMDGQKVPRYRLLQLATASLALHGAEFALALLVLIDLGNRDLLERAAVLRPAALHFDLLQGIRKSEQGVVNLLSIGRVNVFFSLLRLFLQLTTFDRGTHLHWRLLLDPNQVEKQAISFVVLRHGLGRPVQRGQYRASFLLHLQRVGIVIHFGLIFGN